MPYFGLELVQGGRKGSQANVGFPLAAADVVSGSAARTKSIEITESCRNSVCPA